MAIDLTDVYKKYKGLWVVFDQELKKVIVSGRSAKVVFQKAKKVKSNNPILFRVPKENLPYFSNFSNFSKSNI